jgi:hypothetical protein
MLRSILIQSQLECKHEHRPTSSSWLIVFGVKYMYRMNIQHLTCRAGLWTVIVTPMSRHSVTRISYLR